MKKNMKDKIKIVLVNHSFQINYFSRRWELFAEEHPDVDVYLFAPLQFEWYKGKFYTYGNAKTLNASDLDKGNFHRRTFRLNNHKLIGWTSPDFKHLLQEIQPDVIYNIGTHNMLSLGQLISIRNRVLPNTKVIAFSMRGPALNIRLKKDRCNPVRWMARRIMYLYQRGLLNYINKNVSAFFCHYPKAVECFREEGYKGPIYMQTQVGVNEEWFHEDAGARTEIRNKYNLGDAFVFGSATRFTPDKGIDIILKSLPKEGNWKYLMMGSGSEEDTNRLLSIIKDRGLEDKVIPTGFVDWYDMAKYWNAVDCAIHVPLTTPNWEETFSLAAIQPQITRKPVIGDNSGSVPYQIGYEEWIVPEGDISALSRKIEAVLQNQDEARRMGDIMYERTHNSFEIRHLNELFYKTLTEDVMEGVYDQKKHDMTQFNHSK